MQQLDAAQVIKTLSAALGHLHQWLIVKEMTTSFLRVNSA
jgi:hypothetical protein